MKLKYYLIIDLEATCCNKGMVPKDTALDHVGLELLGTHHRGIDDARNMGCLMPFIVNER